MPPHYHAALQVRAPLKEATLYGTVLELVDFYHAQFEMIFPPLNSSLLLFKHVRDLGLPSKSSQFLLAHQSNILQLRSFQQSVDLLISWISTSPFF